MSKQITLDEILAVMDENSRKNYAMTELLAQTFCAFVVATGNKDIITTFIKHSCSTAMLKEEHRHAQKSLVEMLNSIEAAKKQ